MVHAKHPYKERSESYYVLREMYKKRYGESFPKMTFNLDDIGSRVWPQVKEHSMTYPKDQPERRDFCGPDWTFVHWPSSRIESSRETFEDILRAGGRSPACDKVAWFGNTKSAGRNVPEHRTRPLLVDHFGRLHPDRFEFKKAGGKSKTYISLPEMVSKYRFLLDIGGAGYSGRTKFLLFSGRPLFMVERRYVEYFSEDLKPWEHFIPVRNDLSDLVEMHDWAVDNRLECERMGERAREFAVKNFTEEMILARLKTVFDNLP